jgi:hypothetical protein
LPQFVRSRTARNQLKSVLEKADISLDAFCTRSGLDRDLARSVVEDDRILPDTEMLIAAGRAFPSIAVADLFVHDLEDASSTAGDMIGHAGPMQVTICGCGNLGHVFGGLLATRQDLIVNILVSTPERAQELRSVTDAGITVTFADRQVTGTPQLVTADAGQAIPGSDIVILCLPSFVEEEILGRVLPHLKDGAYVGAAPAPGGFDWKAQRILDQHGRTTTVFGLAAIPWMCKIVTPGQEVRVLGAKSFNAQVTMPGADSAQVSDLLGHLLQMPVLRLRSFLNMTLNPGNQLLHPGIMYDMFAGREGVPIAEPPLFYESITGSAADRLQRMSDELLQIRVALEARIDGLQLSAVLPIGHSILQAYAEHITDASSLQAIIRGNRAYAGLRTPMRPVDGGFLLDENSRFFWEDIPHGLVVLRGLADLAGVAVPTIDEVLLWAQQVMDRVYLVDGRLDGPDVASSGAPQCYGISSLSQLAPE